VNAVANRVAQILARERTRFLRHVRKRLWRISLMDVEDIVADVIFGLVKRADIGGEMENIMAYAYRSLENRIVDFRRHSRDMVSIDDEATEDPALDSLLAEHDTPERSLARMQTRDRLLWAIGKLSPGERSLWIATEIDGRAVRELSEEWGEPIGTLLSRKSRTNAKLREFLRDYKQ
jgi:RNA polymerase sigma factor (sigma-70 family)